MSYQVLTVFNWHSGCLVDSHYRPVVAGYPDEAYRRDGYLVDNLPYRNWMHLEKLIPNAPMEARKTLLAELLRGKGYGLVFPTINGPRRSVKTPKTPNSEVDPITIRANPIKTIKSSPRHVGKLLGVEIEYYPSCLSGSSPKQGPFCNVGSDSSLSSGGSEIRKLTWTAEDGRLKGLLALRLRGTVDGKCGLHVHVDARHLGSNGLFTAKETYYRLISLYPFIKRLVPKSRWESTYCRWENNGPGGVMQGNRYAAINFESFNEHGTIEFRCQAGSTNLLKIETWALLCQYLVNYCAKPSNHAVKTFAQFLGILPEPLKTWARLRAIRLHSKINNEFTFDERSLSANQPD